MVFTRQGRSLYLTGFGGFGLSLDVSHAEASWSVALVQGPRPPRHAPSLGAGYTTLMAKHLACGSIPFAQNRDWVVSVYVNDEVLAAIKEGGNIVDKRAFGGDSLEFLCRLPGDKHIDAFYGEYKDADAQKSPGPSFGAILHADRKTELGTWPHAVAQIAFGGLVPQANPNVVEAVRFTSTGLEEDMGECVVALESLVDMLHGSQEDDHLFGDNVSGRCAAEGHSWVNYTFHSEHSNAPDAVAIFARYSNLLERAIAMVVGRPIPGEQTGTSQARPQTQGLPASCGRLVREGDIVEAAGRELEKSYRAAVARMTREAVATGPAGPAARNLESIQEVKTRFRESGVLEVFDVAIIVRCLLSSWAFTVPLIEVKQTAEMRGAAGTPSAGTTKLVNEIVLSNLPPISALS
ncbi:hypothetical protein B0H63DRAFT_515599 [Podospora didyma]|uniref:Uncharacterized protein n=1 Tax=Podospora didyma TaxID=330526 RepID=A0AAE0N2I5_9PEZI|nr:hypothetical protein B0H63DRAFT_515599 [Podospora didyma]